MCFVICRQNKLLEINDFATSYASVFICIRLLIISLYRTVSFYYHQNALNWHKCKILNCEYNERFHSQAKRKRVLLNFWNCYVIWKFHGTVCVCVYFILDSGRLNIGTTWNILWNENAAGHFVIKLYLLSIWLNLILMYKQQATVFDTGTAN